MADVRLGATLDELHRDLDLVVFALERPAPSELELARAERARLRRDLERLRDRLGELIRNL